MTSLGIPNLTSVVADVLPIVRVVYALYLQENTELCLSDSEFWKLRKLDRSLLYGMKICGPVTNWQWQVLIIRGNYFMTSVEFPKLTKWSHFGKEPQLTNSANTIWNYTPENCKLFLRIPFFSIKDTYSNCGLIPIINDGLLSSWVLIQMAEKVASLTVNGILCLYLAIKLFQSHVSVNFFHFAIVTFILLTISETLFVNLDYVQIFDDNGFAIPYGLRSLFINKDVALFNQISNVMYVNRLALLISSAIYRPLYLLSTNYEKYGLVVSAAVFVLSNVWNLSVMETLQNNFTYVLYQLNWITLILTIITGILVKVILKKKYPTYTEASSHHNQLSIGLFLQALWTFLFCGYSDGLNQYILRNTQSFDLVRKWEKFFYWYGGVMMRWHYGMLIIIIVVYLKSTFVRFPNKPNITSVESSSKAVAN